MCAFGEKLSEKNKKKEKEFFPLIRNSFRFKNSFFRSQEACKKSEKRLLQLLKSEVAAGPISRQGSMELVEIPDPSEGLDAAFEAIKQIARRNDDGIVKETEEDVLKTYLASKLETSCLAWWEKFEASSKNCRIKLALCKLAKQFLTPPPTSTNCERLFSVAGQIMDEKRANLLPDNLEKILFLRENILITNYILDW